MANFSFNPATGLQDVSAYPTNPGTEAAAREQIQRGLNQIKDYINTGLVNELDKGQSGYFKDKQTGFLIQWLTVEVKDNNISYDMSFPLQFPSFCVGAFLQPSMSSDIPTYGITGVTTSKFTIRKQSANWVYPCVFAIGY